MVEQTQNTSVEANENNQTSQKKDYTVYAQFALVILLGVMFLYVLKTQGYIGGNSGTGNVIAPSVSASEIMPVGIPRIYGSELGVSYNDVTSADSGKADKTISLLGNLDNTITLSGKDKERYIGVASKISCEYCCGTDSIIFKDGEAACGCAHSYAMRGLAKYLITKHGSEFTDDDILSEMGKWKVLFFPGQHMKKAGVLKSQNVELNYINLASNKYRDVEK